MESFERLESRGGLTRSSANAGSLSTAFSQGALLSGDESLRILYVRGRSYSTGRFEMPPELWRVLSGRLGWRDVHAITTGR